MRLAEARVNEKKEMRRTAGAEVKKAQPLGLGIHWPLGFGPAHASIFVRVACKFTTRHQIESIFISDKFEPEKMMYCPNA
jgi:hypothetical protein